MKKMILALIVTLFAGSAMAADYGAWSAGVNNDGSVHLAITMSENDSDVGFLVLFSTEWGCAGRASLMHVSNDANYEEQWMPVEGIIVQYRVDTNNVFTVEPTKLYMNKQSFSVVSDMEDGFLAELVQGRDLRVKFQFEDKADFHRMSLSGSSRALAEAEASCLANLEPSDSSYFQDADADAAYF